MAEAPVLRRPRVVLSTVSSDAHTWNLVFLQLLMEEHGYEVVNLGPCVPDELLVDTVRRERPDALVISSVNGHGYLDGMRVIRSLRADEAGARVPVVIGGKLGILGEANAGYAERLVEAGFDAVLVDCPPEALITRLSALPAPPALPAVPVRPVEPVRPASQESPV